MAHINQMGEGTLPSITELFSLAGKTAICTGATGGLGLSMSIALAEAGADLVSIQMANDPRADLLKEGVAACGRKLQVFETDVADSPALRKCFADIWAAGVVPDILLNCAGINRRSQVENFTDEDIDAVSAGACSITGIDLLRCLQSIRRLHLLQHRRWERSCWSLRGLGR